MDRVIPRGREPSSDRRKSGWFAVWTCLLLVAAPVELLSQAPDAIPTFQIPTRTFNIPFRTDNDPRVQDVLLYASTDKVNYRHVGTARPEDRRFFYQAPGDGWYYFIVQTRDRAGGLTPADLRGAPDSMRVCVDTERPVIEQLEQTRPEEGYPVGIRWSVRDKNFQEVWADYRSTSGNATWYPLLLPSQPQGAFPWKPAVIGELEVRMQARDKAGNQSEPKTITLQVSKDVADKAPPPEPIGPGNVLHVRNRTFQLEYDLDKTTIGPSKVQRVDVWKIRPGGAWQKCKEFGDGKSTTISVTVDASGRWGFRLIPRNGVGLAERDPKAGDSPDIWVEVDDRVPEVKLTNVTVARTGDGGYLTVFWKANDTFLRPTPITISYSINGQDGWLAFAENITNSGNWSSKTDDLKLPPGCFEFYLKVSAIDEAGNVGEDQWRETVKVDLKIPRLLRINIKAGGANPSPAQSSSRQPSGSPMPESIPTSGNGYGNTFDRPLQQQKSPP